MPLIAQQYQHASSKTPESQAETDYKPLGDPIEIQPIQNFPVPGIKGIHIWVGPQNTHLEVTIINKGKENPIIVHLDREVEYKNLEIGLDEPDEKVAMYQKTIQPDSKTEVLHLWRRYNYELIIVGGTLEEIENNPPSHYTVISTQEQY